MAAPASTPSPNGHAAAPPQSLLDRLNQLDQPAPTPTEDMSQYTCSINSLFNQFQLCFTPIPQVKQWYRHGTYRSCKKEREELMFCVGLTGKPKAEQQRRIKERQDAQRHLKMTQRPSQAVWALRTAPPPGFPPPVEPEPVDAQHAVPAPPPS